MARSPYWITAVFTASTALWSTRLVLDPEPLGDAAGALLGADLALLGAVAVAGVLVARGRWARVLAVALSGSWLSLGAVMPLDPFGVAATLVAGASLAGTAGPWLARAWLRHRPSSDGPPEAAVVLMLGLLAVPGVVALSGRPGLGVLDWLVAGSSVAATWGLGRGMPAALWWIRLAMPALAIAAGVQAGFPHGLVLAGPAAALTTVSWRRDLAVAVSPLGPVPTKGVPIPPELAPPEVLEAAGLDDRGRPAGGR